MKTVKCILNGRFKMTAFSAILRGLLKCFTLITIQVLIFFPANAQQLSIKEEQFVDSVMNANYKPGEPGAVLLIARNGQPVFRKGYGLANLEFNVPNKPENIFNIGSMSKQFTAVCILKLAQEGRLNLHDDIKKYLPDYNNHGRKITIENLLTHTSGISEFTEKKEFPARSVLNQSHEELLNSFMNDSLAFEPGTDWAYSNSGYVVAGIIVEKVSGISLSQYLLQNIFAPLGMSHSSIATNDSLIINEAYGYNLMNSKYKPIEYTSPTWMYAAGGILSCVDDLLKWDNALYTEKILKKEWLEKAWKPFVLQNGQGTNYGMGWTSNNYKGLQFIEHAGGINGFSSDAIRIPSQQLYFVILSNKSNWLVPMLSSITLQLLRQPITKSSINQPDKNKLQEYTGVFEVRHSFYSRPPDPHQPIYQYITLKEDTLFNQLSGNREGSLRYAGGDLFVLPNLNLYYLFHRNEEKTIVSLEIYSEPIQTGPHDIQLKTGLPLPKTKKSIVPDMKTLAQVKGKYDFGGGFVLSVIVEGTKVFLLMDKKEEILAENETDFFSKTTDVTLQFIKKDDVVSGVIVGVQGTKYEGKKFE